MDSGSIVIGIPTWCEAQTIRLLVERIDEAVSRPGSHRVPIRESPRGEKAVGGAGSDGGKDGGMPWLTPGAAWAVRIHGVDSSYLCGLKLKFDT